MAEVEMSRRAGALVLHGFTGNPTSMQGVADALAAAGFTVELPLLPGHGTSIEDMLKTDFSDWSAAAEAAYDELAARCDSMVVAGLSMGGTLAAWVTAKNPATAGLVAINGMFEPPAPAFLDMLRTTLDQGVECLPAIGSDIALPGVTEGAYDAAPIAGLISLLEATSELQGRLGQIR
ncbi:MAG TPA: alpha/beta fold hydrolase, partial [Acidimicrobiia bacterium]|nr:alpha/beta fold hydrolase [Acidimicrobiia bacterium]